MGIVGNGNAGPLDGCHSGIDMTKVRAFSWIAFTGEVNGHCNGVGKLPGVHCRRDGYVVDAVVCRRQAADKGDSPLIARIDITGCDIKFVCRFNQIR